MAFGDATERLKDRLQQGEDLGWLTNGAPGGETGDVGEQDSDLWEQIRDRSRSHAPTESTPKGLVRGRILTLG